MKKPTLLIVLVLLLGLPCVAAQLTEQVSVSSGDSIETVEVSGVPEERLSQGLRGDLRALEGKTYSADVALQLADRIQSELPEYVAATRTAPGSTEGRVRLVFVVARVSDNDALGENINSRYPIESVEVEGIPRSQISDALWNELQQMVGKMLNDEEAERLRKALEMELGNRYVVARKVRRGQQARQLAVVYDVVKTPLLRWIKPLSKIAIQQKQAMTIFVNGDEDLSEDFDLKLQFGLGTNGDDLIERFKGFRLGVEKLNLGTERLGFRLDLASYGTLWKLETDNAAAALPVSGLYRSRRAIEPSFAFAIMEGFYVTAGFNATELEMQDPSSHWEPVRSGIASAEFRRTFHSGEQSHQVTAVYGVRTGANSLGSDFVYTRHSWEGGYVFRKDKNIAKIDLLAGRITGNAPMFERFSIGNTHTARGWNKYEINPLGGSRVAHGTVELGREDVRVFYDAGSVWDPGTPIRVRQSVGLTFGAGDDKADGFFTIAAAMRNSKLSLAVMLQFGWR